MGVQWKCDECGTTWPAYSTWEATRKHMHARSIHPGRPCGRADDGPSTSEPMTEGQLKVYRELLDAGCHDPYKGRTGITALQASAAIATMRREYRRLYE